MPPPDLSAGVPGPVAWRHPVRVYFQDTDAGGIVYHGTYLNFLERARTEWLRHLGIDLRAMALAGAQFIVHEMSIQYLKPALLDDALTITVAPWLLGRAHFTLAQTVLRAESLLVRGSVSLACVHPSTLRPVRLPPALRQALGAAAEDTAP